MMRLRVALYLLRVARRHPEQRVFLHRWMQSLRRDYLLETGTPWITFAAADHIAGQIRPGMRVFEYGSGGSTFFWLRHGARVVSIEHDNAWYEAVRRRLTAGASVDYRLVLPEPADHGGEGAEANPSAYRSADPLFRQYRFERYARQIDEFPDAFFDIVLVDGRARASCLVHGARKVRPGGLLILDNAERDYYTAMAGEALGAFSACDFVGVGPCLNWSWKTRCYARIATHSDR